MNVPSTEGASLTIASRGQPLACLIQLSTTSVPSADRGRPSLNPLPCGSPHPSPKCLIVTSLLQPANTPSPSHGCSSRTQSAASKCHERWGWRAGPGRGRGGMTQSPDSLNARKHISEGSERKKAAPCKGRNAERGPIANSLEQGPFPAQWGPNPDQGLWALL